MLNSGSCERTETALQHLASGPAGLSTARLRALAGGGQDQETLKAVSRDFAVIFYSALVREMQKTVRSDEEPGPVEQGVQGFIGLYLPRAIAGSGDDPLARQIYEHLKAAYGDPTNGTT